MGKAQEMMDRKGQDDLMPVMIERLKKDPELIELIKIKILTFELFQSLQRRNLFRNDHLFLERC
jgi:hypothetical protein